MYSKKEIEEIIKEHIKQRGHLVDEEMEDIEIEQVTPLNNRSTLITAEFPFIYGGFIERLDKRRYKFIQISELCEKIAIYIHY